MSSKAAITVLRPPDELRELWRGHESKLQHIQNSEASVTFAPAPGDRGTEIHVDLTKFERPRLLSRMIGKPRLAKVKDELRHFKQQVETGVIPRSDGAPAGEQAEQKFRRRPAQPLSESELQEVGA